MFALCFDTIDILFFYAKRHNPDARFLKLGATFELCFCLFHSEGQPRAFGLWAKSPQSSNEISCPSCYFQTKRDVDVELGS